MRLLIYAAAGFAGFSLLVEMNKTGKLPSPLPQALAAGAVAVTWYQFGAREAAALAAGGFGAFLSGLSQRTPGVGNI